MKQQKTFLVALIAVLIILALSGTGSSAQELQSNAKVVSAAAPNSSVNALATTHVLVIPAAEFRHDGNKPDKGFFSFLGGYWRGEASPNIPCFMAPVYIPRVANISEVWASVYDNDGEADFWINLYRVDNYSGAVTSMATLNSSGSSSSLKSIYDLSIQGGTVSYPQYSYYLGTCLESSSHRLYSVRVWYYDYETHLPMIMK